MDRREFIAKGEKGLLGGICIPPLMASKPEDIGIEIEQISFCLDHHFFGYIGQSLTISWNKKGNRLVCLSKPFHDHLPGKNESANVNLIHLDHKKNGQYKLEKLDESQGWNHHNNNQVLVSGLDEKQIRQLFIISIPSKNIESIVWK